MKTKFRNQKQSFYTEGGHQPTYFLARFVKVSYNLGFFQSKSSNSSNNRIFSVHFQELMGTRKKRKQILTLIGLLLLGIIVIIGIVLAVVLTSNSGKKEESSALVDKRDPITLDDYLRGRMGIRKFNGTWISDDTCHFFDIIVSNGLILNVSRLILNF